MRGGTLQFLDFSDVARSCLVINDTEHDNDVAQQPYLNIAWGGDPADKCVGSALFTITAAWKDRYACDPDFSVTCDLSVPASTK